ncbi:MAG: hypothetical protein JXI43_12965 [Tissierellales bacterium]|nr:hypothetical protein [Tissierellales bacterium]
MNTIIGWKKHFVAWLKFVGTFVGIVFLAILAQYFSLNEISPKLWYIKLVISLGTASGSITLWYKLTKDTDFFKICLGSSGKIFKILRFLFWKQISLWVIIFVIISIFTWIIHSYMFFDKNKSNYQIFEEKTINITGWKEIGLQEGEIPKIKELVVKLFKLTNTDYPLGEPRAFSFHNSAELFTEIGLGDYIKKLSSSQIYFGCGKEVNELKLSKTSADEKERYWIGDLCGYTNFADNKQDATFRILIDKADGKYKIDRILILQQ